MKNINQIFKDAKNPFPEDVFIKKVKEDWLLFHNVLKKENLSGDGYFLVYITKESKENIKKQIEFRIKQFKLEEEDFEEFWHNLIKIL